MEASLLIKFPSRSRPSKFLETIENITELIGMNDYVIQATLDSDDESMNNHDVKVKMSKCHNLVYIFGDSKSKCAAINRDMDLEIFEWKVCILMSDDMRFSEYGFGKNILVDMKTNFPNYDGVLHYPDSHQKDKLITLSIFGINYYRRFNYIYHPDYKNVYADNEFTRVAKSLGKYKFLPRQIFDHYHPVWGMSEWDEQYRAQNNSQTYSDDMMVFRKREQLNFPL